MADYGPQDVRQVTPELLSSLMRTLRPFGQGERINNQDGTYSTERSRTFPLPDGSWVNAPSLWMSQEGPVDFGDSEDMLRALLQFYEKSGGTAFPRFKTVDEAEAAARARSAAGGAGAGPYGQFQP